MVQLTNRPGSRVPIAKPSFDDADARAVQGPVESGWVLQGPRVAEFERRFAEAIGAEHAVAATSGTTALHLATAIMGAGEGDEVIVPAFTWIATPNVVSYTGAVPRFCDVRLEGFNIDPALVEELITPCTVGILPVHSFGLCAEMQAIGEIARRHGLWVIEDAACAFGAWHDGRHAGTFGDIAAFSFHPRKSITTGEGGMLITASAEWDARARALRDHGAERSDLGEGHGLLLPEFNLLGYNYRMTDIQAALGCSQLDRAEWILGERRRRAGLYDQALADVEWLGLPSAPEGDVHGFQAYVCLFRPEEPSLDNLDRLSELRNRVMERMEERGVSTRQGTHAPALTGLYSGRQRLEREQVPNAALADGLSLALPLYPDMTDSDQELVLTELRAAFEAA